MPVVALVIHGSKQELGAVVLLSIETRTRAFLLSFGNADCRAGGISQQLRRRVTCLVLLSIRTKIP